MPNLLLLHTNREYAKSLARSVESLDAEYNVTVVSRKPFQDRLPHILKGQYDLVQTDELLVNGVLALGGSLIGTPFVVSIRGWADYTNAHGEYGKIRENLIRMRTRAVLRKSQQVIFLSELTREKFTNQYEVADSSVIGRPINIEYYRSGETKNKDNFGLLTVTNLRYEEKYKGVKTILNGLANEFEQHDDLCYTIAGDGRYLTNLKHFLKDYQYSDQVQVVGYRNDIPDLLASADAFVYISYLDAYPTVVLEAQAAGLPVIGGNAVGVPAVVGDAGLVISPTPEKVGQAIERVIEYETLRNTLVCLSKKKMATYNQECARRHIEVWDRALNR